MKIKAVLAGMLAMSFVGAALAAQEDWADDTSVFADNPAFEPSRALCREVRGREPPAADRPSAAQRSELADCDSEALYYGIGMPADAERARLCAFAEIEEGRANAPFSGRVVLMTIYANGVGARRDLDVARHLACDIDGAPMEIDGRVTHLAQLKARNWTGSDFSFCDDITSGLAAGYCADHGARIAEAGREAELATLTARYTVPQREAYAALIAARDAFIDARAEGEIDLSGTMRVAFAVGAQDAVAAEFLETVRRLSEGRIPAASFGEADAALNAAYAGRRRSFERDDDQGTVTWEQVRGAQRTWLSYRDAFLAFAGATYPAVPRDHLAAWLTRQRTQMLEHPGE